MSDHPSKLRRHIRSKGPWWVGILIAVGTAGAVMLFKDIVLLPSEIQTVEAAEKEHKELDEKKMDKKDHNSDKVLIEQRIHSIEEAEKLKVEQINKMDNRQWKILEIVKDIQRNGR